MQNQKSKLLAILSWFLPSGSEVAISLAISFLTLAISNAEFFRNVIFLPRDFSPTTAVLDSINNLLVQIVGDNVARSAVVAIFWAMVGLVVYLIIWVGMNFSDELGNDLATTKYMHPRYADTRSPLKNFISRVSFQLTALLVLIFYLNLMVGVLLPYIGGLYRSAIGNWFSIDAVKHAAIGILSQLVILHFFVILVRAVTLRKQIFG